MSESPSAAVYRKVFGSEEGQAVLADLMAFVKLWDNGYDPDPRRAERVSGMEDVILFILERSGIEMPEQYPDIVRAMLAMPALKPQPQPTEADGDDIA